MRVITDKSFQGEDGMVRVWNATPGFVQVTEEGHLLGAQKSAWVDDNPAVQELIEIGHVVVVGGSSKKSAKKNGKAKTKPTSQQESVSTDSPPVAQEEPTEVIQQTEEVVQETQDSVLDQLILDSSTLSDNSDSVSVENI